MNNASEIQLVTLNEKALSFIKGELNYGSSLAKGLIKINTFDDGQVTAYLPASLDFEKIPDFNRSIYLETGITVGNLAEQKTTDFIIEYLEKDKSRCFVVETYYQYPENELFLKNHSIPYFVFDTEVYFFLTATNFNREILHKVLHSARDYPFISYLTSSLERLSLLANKETVESLGKHTRFILVGAFDAEGYHLILKKGDEKIRRNQKKPA